MANPTGKNTPLLDLERLRAVAVYVNDRRWKNADVFLVARELGCLREATLIITKWGDPEKKFNMLEAYQYAAVAEAYPDKSKRPEFVDAFLNMNLPDTIEFFTTDNT